MPIVALIGILHYKANTREVGLAFQRADALPLALKPHTSRFAETDAIDGMKRSGRQFLCRIGIKMVAEPRGIEFRRRLVQIVFAEAKLCAKRAEGVSAVLLEMTGKGTGGLPLGRRPHAIQAGERFM
jgi:hypothetical protein